MSTASVHKVIKIRVWRVANATILWLGLLLPWMKVDSFEEVNPFVISIIGLSDFWALQSNSSTEELAAAISGILISIGFVAILIYASLEWVYSVSSEHLQKTNLRALFLFGGFIAVTVMSAYFYYVAQDRGATHITGYALKGYWLFWLGLLSSSIFIMVTKNERSIQL